MGTTHKLCKQDFHVLWPSSPHRRRVNYISLFCSKDIWRYKRTIGRTFMYLIYVPKIPWIYVPKNIYVPKSFLKEYGPMKPLWNIVRSETISFKSYKIFKSELEIRYLTLKRCTSAKDSNFGAIAGVGTTAWHVNSLHLSEEREFI